MAHNTMKSKVIGEDYLGRQSQNTFFGDRQFGHREPHILVNFVYGVLNDVAEVTTGNGTVTTSDGTLTLSTGAGNGLASLESKDILRYQPGYEGYAYFTMANNLSDAGSSAEAGLYGDDDNAIFMRFTGGGDYQGLEFVRLSGGVEDVQPFDPPVDVDLDKISIYKITYGYLGIAPIKFEGAVRGKGWVLLHEFDLQGQLEVVTFNQPSMRFKMLVERTSGSGAITLKSGSWSCGTVGAAGILPSDKGDEFHVTKTGIVTEVALFTIKNPATFGGINNNSIIEFDFVTASSDSAKPVVIHMKSNVTLGGTPSYTDITSGLPAQVDVAGTTVTGGSSELPLSLAKSGNLDRNIQYMRIKLYPGEIMTFSAESSGAGGDVGFGIRFRNKM